MDDATQRLQNAARKVDGDAGSVILAILTFIFVTLPSIALTVLSFVTITVPTTIYAVLSYTITLRVPFTSVLLSLVAVAALTTVFVRYRYLNKYSKLKATPIAKDDSFDLHPDAATMDDGKPGFHNYLDEFLSAIKIFGYLEKPVFHELARHLQTRKLVAGDTLSLEHDRSFYVVVDGLVQVYVKSDEHESLQRDEDYLDEDQSNGYTLLNEVGSGGTLSSLFSILSLFTDQVKIRYEEHTPEDPEVQATSPNIRPSGSPMPSPLINGSPRGRPHLQSEFDITRLDLNPRQRRASKLQASHGATDFRTPSPNRRPEAINPVHLNIVARATEDTTLAVLPPEAFQRLTHKYPNAAAHIVQVILTRFQRVTFLASHKYLGLTKEVLRAEKAINDIATYALPRSFFENSGMEKLRQEFSAENETATADNDEGETYFSTHPSPAATDTYFALDPPTPAAGLRPAFLSEMTRKSSITSASKKGSRPSSITTPADLLNDARSRRDQNGRPRRTSIQTPGAETDQDAKFSLHEEVMDCICKSIGCVQNAVAMPDSIEQSPRLNPQDSVFHRAVFNNALGTGSSVGDFPDDVSVHSGASNSQAIAADLDIRVHVQKFKQGDVLIQQGERDAGLYYLIDGFLDVSIDDGEGDESKKRSLFTVKPGGIAGYLASLSGYPSFVEIQAKTDVYVGFLSSEGLLKIMSRQPIVLFTLAKRLISLLSPLVLQIDFALEWVQAAGGHVLYRQGDKSDDIYLVLNGRMRTIREKGGGGIEILSEIGHGESVGELEVLTETPRSCTLHAIRDSELCRIPRTLFKALAGRNPGITLRISRLIATKMRQQYESKASHPGYAPFGGKDSGLTPVNESGRNNFNLKTVGILPVNGSVPVVEFADRLREALEGIVDSVSFLNQATVLKAMGRHAFNRMGKLKLATWLADQEENFGIVLYLADTAVNSGWTQTVIRQADCLLLIAASDGDPAIGEYERFMLGMKTTARKELVLLHQERFCESGLTREWLKNRSWVHAHHHIQMSMRSNREVAMTHPTHRTTQRVRAVAKDAVLNIRTRVQTELQKYTGRSMVKKSSVQKSSHDDFPRLARRLCGKTVGLVLGGGGARGLAHIGFIQALEEADIPIDIVGGTSIGAYVGGLYARDADVVSIIGRAKKFSGRMSSLWRQVSDVTYPFTSYTTGHEFNRGIYKSFYNTQIEDLWLPYFCVTTNITWSRKEIHLQGYAWRYVRASMTLAGFLPPICDNGNLLMDGGYVDNVPVSTMQAMGAEQIIAIDVGRMDDNVGHEYGDSLSGWWIMINRWNPFSKYPTPPSVAEIQSRLAYVSSAKSLLEAKSTPGVLYTRPPVQAYGTLEFGKFDEIFKIGYEHGQKMIAEWQGKGHLVRLQSKPGVRTSSQKRAGRRNSV